MQQKYKRRFNALYEYLNQNKDEKPEELVNHRVNDTEESMSKDLTKSTDIVDEQAELEKQIKEEDD